MTYADGQTAGYAIDSEDPKNQPFIRPPINTHAEPLDPDTEAFILFSGLPLLVRDAMRTGLGAGFGGITAATLFGPKSTDTFRKQFFNSLHVVDTMNNMVTLYSTGIVNTLIGMYKRFRNPFDLLDICTWPLTLSMSPEPRKVLEVFSQATQLPMSCFTALVIPGQRRPRVVDAIMTMCKRFQEECTHILAHQCLSDQSPWKYCNLMPANLAWLNMLHDHGFFGTDVKVMRGGGSLVSHIANSIHSGEKGNEVMLAWKRRPDPTNTTITVFGQPTGGKPGSANNLPGYASNSGLVVDAVTADASTNQAPEEESKAKYHCWKCGAFPSEWTKHRHGRYHYHAECMLDHDKWPPRPTFSSASKRQGGDQGGKH